MIRIIFNLKHFAIGIGMLNGWVTDEFHLFRIDIFNERPPQEIQGVCGVNLDVVGFGLSVILIYVKN